MEESPYSIPNSIPPSLVVFSQSGYGDPIRMQRPFSSQVSDGKDGLGGLPNLSPSTFGLRPMDAFPGLPAQLVHLQNPFLHPALESHRLQFGSSTGAFRPIVTTSASANSTHSNNNNNNSHHGEAGSHNGPGNVKGIPSAFSAPALSTSSRRKLDSIVESVMESRSREQQQASGASTSSSGANAMNLDKGYINGQGGGHHPHHPHQQQHRHRSASPANSNSSPPQHHQPHHRHLHHQQQHVPGHNRKDERGGGDQDERDENMTPNSEMTDRSSPEDLTPPPANQQQQSSKRRRKGNGCDGLSCPVCKMSLRPHDLEAHLLAEVEQLMCMSRLRRQQHLPRDEASASSSGDSPSGSMKKDGGGSEISHDSRWETYHRIRANRHSRLRIKTRRRREESGGGAHVTCPVCQVPLQGTNEQFSAHVETCLRKNGDVLDEDEPVDIEGDGDTNDTDEYNWIHNRRVNSRNNPGIAINMTTNSRRRDEDSDMLEVVVDGDETSTYGQPQYTEADIMAAAAMASCSSESNNSQKETKNKWGENDESGGEDLSTSTGNSVTNHDNGNGDGNLVHALKSKVQDLEQKLKGGVSSNCLVCMDKYKKPVVSVSCWHVHCEHCWLKSLFNQKLCPQCNAITSASDLRRIFL